MPTHGIGPKASRRQFEIGQRDVTGLAALLFVGAGVITDDVTDSCEEFRHEIRSQERLTGHNAEIVTCRLASEGGGPVQDHDLAIFHF